MLKSNKKYVYMVQYDNSTIDSRCNSVYLYSSRKKAIKKFEEIVNDCKECWDNFISNKNNKINVDFELDTNIENINDKNTDIYWYVKETLDYIEHDKVDLIKKEIK